MRTPVKLNKAGWPAWALAFLPKMDDPRQLARGAVADPEAFSRMVSTIKVGSTWRTTQARRHGRSDLEVRRLLAGSRPYILDVGASDGTTSLDLIQKLKDGFARYYVTDKVLEVRVLAARPAVFFYDPQGAPLMAATPRLVAYADCSDADPLSRRLARGLIAQAPPLAAGGARPVSLVQEELSDLCRRDPRVRLLAYDILEPWSGPPLDLVKAANILNPGYFSPEDLLRAAGGFFAALAPEGRLLVLDNDPGERFVIYRKTARGIVLESAFGGEVRAAQIIARAAAQA